MSIREKLARSGNSNRIMEMHAAGMGVNQIAGVFADNRIPSVTRDVVVGTIASHKELGVKALPKSAARDAIAAHRGVDNSGAFNLAPQ